ncbi:MAG: hypothetical protein IJ514_05765 [Clostridia bacterium]|nr:hypothetical protein [Clostridia bacterium]
MRKLLITFLVIMLSLLCLCACKDTPAVDAPPSTGEPTTEKTGDPEFPENAFDEDNEVIYPDAWK